MKQLTINLLTKEEAKIFCRRMYLATKIVPVTLCENGICTTYYTVYVVNANDEWVLAQDIKPEYVRE